MNTVQTAAAVFVLAQSVVGQAANARYELAVRVRELERRWVLNLDATARASALPDLERAVQSSFGAKLAVAARALDDASAKLSGARMVWAESLAVTLDHALCDVKEAKLDVVVERFYECTDARPVALGAEVVGDWDARIEQALLSKPLGERSMNLSGLAPGDHEVHLELEDADGQSYERTTWLSVVERRDERLAALEEALATLSAKAPALERETATELIALLESLATGATEETDYPAARLLGECEQVVAAASKGESWYGPQHTGEFWLALPTGPMPSRVHVFVPSGLAPDKPVPLVVALNGAGSSENMFFDTYGNGATVKLCEERGWVLVAPYIATLGGPPVHDIVDAIVERYPVDTTRVVLVGHSVGAGFGVEAVQKDAGYFRAFAALSSGQVPRAAEKLANLRVFVAAGESDFARRSAEGLHASLVAGGSKLASLKVYPNCEHLLLVTEALPDVFAFFDDALRAK